jgi:octaprenyl-diphosphate synthase
VPAIGKIRLPDLPVPPETAVHEAKSAPDIEELRALVQEDSQAVDRLIRARLYSDVVLINQLSHYIIAGGGKRLRPLLALLSAKAAGYDGTRHIDVAVIIELVHTATLLHDDVVDASKLRRGRETANLVWGNEASVLVGDFLYSRAFQMMVDLENIRVLEILADATNTIAEGEVLQLLNCHDPDIDEENYLRVIRYKTAKLFEAAGRLGAVIGGGTEEEKDALARYGMHLGTAFQLIDDVLDYSGDILETGKNIGDDLAEGKPTLPLLYAMRHGTAEQAACIRQAIEHDGLTEFQSVLAAIKATNALQYTREVAQREIHAANSAISCLADSNSKAALLQLAAFAVDRSF